MRMFNETLNERMVDVTVHLLFNMFRFTVPVSTTIDALRQLVKIECHQRDPESSAQFDWDIKLFDNENNNEIAAETTLAELGIDNDLRLNAAITMTPLEPRNNLNPN